MTVEKLIQMLQAFPADAQVVVHVGQADIFGGDLPPIGRVVVHEGPVRVADGVTLVPVIVIE
jgi:hypothetical protein